MKSTLIRNISVNIFIKLIMFSLIILVFSNVVKYIFTSNWVQMAALLALTVGMCILTALSIAWDIISIVNKAIKEFRGLSVLLDDISSGLAVHATTLQRNAESLSESAEQIKRIQDEQGSG